MTVSVTTPETTYALSGSTLGPFDTVWPYELAEEVAVYLVADGVAVLLNVGADYALVGGSPLSDGGEVTLDVGVLPDGGFDPDVHALVLSRRTPARQSVAFGDFESFRPLTAERAYDRLTRMVQEARRDIAKAVALPVGDIAEAEGLVLGVADGALAWVAGGSGGGGGSGDVTGPASHLSGYVPVWNGINSKTLSAGRAIGAGVSTSLLDRAAGDGRYLLATALDADGALTANSDAKVASQKAVKAYVDAAGGGPTSGYFEVDRVSGGGYTATYDLTDWDRKTHVLFKTGVSGDDNCIELRGLNIGEGCIGRVDQNTSFATTPPGDYTGTCKILANYKAAESGHTGLPVAPEDLIHVERLVDETVGMVTYQRYQVMIIGDKYAYRAIAPGAGSSQNPDGSIIGQGYVGKWDDTSPITSAGLGQYPTSTVRKPYLGGAYLDGVGDSCGVFIRKWMIRGGGEGLEDPEFPQPWGPDDATAIQYNGNHFGTFQSFVDRGTTIAPPDYAPPGWYTGPSSKKGQAFVAQVANYFVVQQATRYGTGGGFSSRVTRPNTDLDIDHTLYAPRGELVVFGGGLLEATGDYSQIGDNFTEDNIVDWGIPNVCVSRLDIFPAWINTFATDANDDDVEKRGFFAAMRVSDPSSGLHGYFRPDEGPGGGMYWWGAAEMGARLRGVGFTEGYSGCFVGGEHAQSWGRQQLPRVDLANNTDMIFQLVPGQMGKLTIQKQNGDYCDFAFADVGGSQTLIKGYSTAPSSFSTTISNSGTVNADINGGDLRVRQNTGGTIALGIKLED